LDGVLSTIGSNIGTPDTITVLARLQIASGTSSNSLQHDTDEIRVKRPRVANDLVLETSRVRKESARSSDRY
jgi:hypothetical protein